jgi:hypothetical protein
MSINKLGISNMELSFTSTKAKGVGLDRKLLSLNGFQKVDYKSLKFIDGYSYMMARSNITIYFNHYNENLTIKENLQLGLQYLLDNKIIQDYDYHQGMVSLTHYIIADIPTTEPSMDFRGCRESDSNHTRFSITHKFKIGANKRLINHPSPTAKISKALASLHKINLLFKASNLEIKGIFSLNNSSSKGNKKFIKNLLHYKITSVIINSSIDNLLGDV